MSGLARILCAGAPRDLGLDQGRAARAAIRGALLNPLASHASRDLVGRVTRDVGRFFPHHAERMQGLSLGAGVSERALLAPLGALLAGDGGLAVAVHGANGALLARSLPAALASLVLRESAPDNDYRSLELAPAAGVTAFIGVNEHGLAATATALPADDALLDGCAAPALLLVQDVLQRFDSAEKAVDWALRRPAGGHASLLLADAGGNVVSVEIEGRTRRARRPEAPVDIGLAPPTAAAALAKAVAAESRLVAETLVRTLRETSRAPGVVAVADPAGRRLGVAVGEAPLVWHAIGGGSAA